MSGEGLATIKALSVGVGLNIPLMYYIRQPRDDLVKSNPNHLQLQEEIVIISDNEVPSFQASSVPTFAGNEKFYNDYCDYLSRRYHFLLNGNESLRLRFSQDHAVCETLSKGVIPSNYESQEAVVKELSFLEAKLNMVVSKSNAVRDKLDSLSKVVDPEIVARRARYYYLSSLMAELVVANSSDRSRLRFLVSLVQPQGQEQQLNLESMSNVNLFAVLLLMQSTLAVTQRTDRVMSFARQEIHRFLMLPCHDDPNASFAEVELNLLDASIAFLEKEIKSCEDQLFADRDRIIEFVSLTKFEDFSLSYPIEKLRQDYVQLSQSSAECYKNLNEADQFLKDLVAMPAEQLAAQKGIPLQAVRVIHEMARVFREESMHDFSLEQSLSEKHSLNFVGLTGGQHEADRLSSSENQRPEGNSLLHIIGHVFFLKSQVQDCEYRLIIDQGRLDDLLSVPGVSLPVSKSTSPSKELALSGRGSVTLFPSVVASLRTFLGTLLPFPISPSKNSVLNAATQTPFANSLRALESELYEQQLATAKLIINNLESQLQQNDSASKFVPDERLQMMYASLLKESELQKEALYLARDENARLAHEHYALESTINQLKKEIQDQQRKQESPSKTISPALDESTAQLKSLTEQLASVKLERNSLLRKIEDLSKANQQLEVDLKLRQSNEVKYVEAEKRLRSYQDQLEHANQNARSSTNVLSKSVNDLESKLEAEQARSKTLQDSLNATQTERDSLKGKLESSEKGSKSLDTHSKELADQLKAEQASKSQLEASKSKLESELATIRADYQKLFSAKEADSKLHDQKLTELTTKSASLQSLEKSSAGLEIQLKAVKDALSKSQAHEGELEKQLAALNSSLSSVTLQLESEKINTSQLKSKLDSETNARHDVEKHKSHLQGEVQTLHGQMDDLNARLKAYHESTNKGDQLSEALRQEIDSLQIQLGNAETKLQVVTDNLELESTKNQESEKKISDAEQRLGDARSQLQDQEQKIRDLSALHQANSEHHSQSEIELNRLRAELEGERGRATVLEQNISSKTSENQSLQSKIAELEAQLAKLGTQVTESQSDRSRLENELASLQIQLSDLTLQQSSNKVSFTLDPQSETVFEEDKQTRQEFTVEGGLVLEEGATPTTEQSQDAFLDDEDIQSEGGDSTKSVGSRSNPSGMLSPAPSVDSLHESVDPTLHENLKNLRTDLSHWINALLGEPATNEETLVQLLADGSILCAVTEKVHIAKGSKEPFGAWTPPANGFKHHRHNLSGSDAEKNVALYLDWLVKNKIHPSLVALPDDIILEKNEDTVLYGLIEVAKRSPSSFPVPEVVMLERAQDRRRNAFDKKDPLDRRVATIVADVCPHLQVQRTDPGKYRIHLDSGAKIYNVREVGKNVMVRVGGGWEELVKFLKSHQKSDARLLMSLRRMDRLSSSETPPQKKTSTVLKK